MSNRLVDDFISLVKIDSPSYGEKELAENIKRILKSLDIDSYEDEAGDIIGGNSGNIFAVWKGDESKDSILLSAHMDTVNPAIGKEAVVWGDVIKSKGDTVLGSDDIAGIVEIIEGIRRVKESGRSHRTVEILFPVAEEVYTKGAAVFDYSKLKSKIAYCFDLSGDVGIAANKAPSLISFEVIVTGKASHAGFAPDEGINAIRTAALAIANINQGQVDNESTVNIGTIEGGSQTNIISEKCIVRGEVRSFNHESALKYIEDIKAEFLKSSEKTKAKIEFNYEIHFKAYEVSEDEEVIRRFLDASAAIGIEGRIVSTLGGADNHQFNAHGIKGVVLSCGMENVHTTDEFIKIENLEKGAKLVEELITY